MDLDIFSIDPLVNSIDVAIDSNIVFEFNQAIDPFTIENGVSLYVLSDGLWTGPELSILDSKYSDVLSVGNENTYFTYTWELQNEYKRLIITPTLGLLPNKKHFIQVLPGNDATRYLSVKTWAEPIYSKVDLSSPSSGTISILSSYTGKTNATYTITLSSSVSGLVDIADIAKDGIYFKTIKVSQNVDIGDITVSFNGSWDDGDEIELDVFQASGVSNIYKTSFITNEYKTISVKSFKIETLNQLDTDPLLLVDVFPKADSVNNQKINPIVLKFNKQIDENQDFSDLISLKKIDIETGEERFVKFVHVVRGNIVKLYLNSVI